MTDKNQTFTVCGEKLTAPMHICGFFDSLEERYDIILPYIAEGLKNNEKVINILEASAHHDHCCRISKAGIPLVEKVASCQLEVLATEDTYLEGGSFAASRMLNLLEKALIDAEKFGYDSVRACGDMSWALTNLPGTDELMEYEARLNILTPKHSCSLICMYDINKFSGRAIADALATHPYVILNGKIRENPYYTEPTQLLSTLLHSENHTLKSSNA